MLVTDQCYIDKRSLLVEFAMDLIFALKYSKRRLILASLPDIASEIRFGKIYLVRCLTDSKSQVPNL